MDRKMTKQNKPDIELSICCRRPARVVGRTTKHYECTNCLKACDTYGFRFIPNSEFPKSRTDNKPVEDWEKRFDRKFWDGRSAISYNGQEPRVMKPALYSERQEIKDFIRTEIDRAREEMRQECDRALPKEEKREVGNYCRECGVDGINTAIIHFNKAISLAHENITKLKK